MVQGQIKKKKGSGLTGFTVHKSAPRTPTLSKASQLARRVVRKNKKVVDIKKIEKTMMGLSDPSASDAKKQKKPASSHSKQKVK